MTLFAILAPMRLTLHQARCLHLHAQGLRQPFTRTRIGADDVLAAIRRMRVLQIDTIHVVARSPYLVLFSRLGAYAPALLDALLADGAIFETWAHEACFAPIEDYPWHRHHLDETASHWALTHARAMLERHPEAMRALLDRIARTGPVRSSDFARSDDRASAWWGWKDEKRWLEAWFALGALMVARRERFQRVYDLRERVLPAHVARAERPRGAAAVRERFILDAVGALGVTQARWVHDYFRLKPRVTLDELHALEARGAVVQVTVDGWTQPGWVHAEHAAPLAQAAAGRLRATHTTLLSPFDPVVWDRERALAMFDFDYRLECYTPAPKRQYGYFVLPILRRGALVARLDAKAHRAQGVFEVKVLHVEPGTHVDDAWIADVGAAIARCAAWHGTAQVRITRTQPRTQPRTLARSLAAAARASRHTAWDSHR